MSRCGHFTRNCGGSFENAQGGYGDCSHGVIIERSVETRVAINRLIEGLPHELSPYIVQSLHPIFTKETSELAIPSLIDTLLKHQGSVIRSNTPMDDKILKLVSAGLTDKRSKIKSAWVVAVAEMLWDLEPSDVNPAVVNFSKSIFKSFLNVFHEVANNAIQACQNGTIISGYAISAAALGRWLSYRDEQFGRRPNVMSSNAKRNLSSQKASSLLQLQSPQSLHSF